MNDNIKAPLDLFGVITQLRTAVERLEAAATHVESIADQRPAGNGDLVRAEAADDLRELHDVVSRRLDVAIARLRTAVGNAGDA